MNIVLSWWWIWTCTSGLLKWLRRYINYCFCLLCISTVHVMFKLQIVCTICLDCALEVIPSWFQNTAGKDSTCLSVPLWYHYRSTTYLQQYSHLSWVSIFHMFEHNLFSSIDVLTNLIFVIVYFVQFWYLWLHPTSDYYLSDIKFCIFCLYWPYPCVVNIIHLNLYYSSDKCLTASLNCWINLAVTENRNVCSS